jgi:RNA polymerase sigma-70 factor (ECF subfamily)
MNTNTSSADGEPNLAGRRTKRRPEVMPSEPLTECSDEVLLACFQRGRREAFALLVQRYERELFGYLRRYLGDANLADDVFQNTFLQLYKKAAKYEPGRPVRPWLYTIATHQAIDALRRAGRHQALSLQQQREALSADGEARALAGMIECSAPGPLDRAQTEERRLCMRNCVERLPDFLRQVVLLAYYQGLKYREIADILGIPVGTVKSRLHAALGKLQEAWTEDVREA